MGFQTLIWLGILGLFATACVHSLGGEKYLLRPLFRHRGNRVLDNALARMVLRFAWHITSVFWLVLALILYVLAFKPPSLEHTILLSVGGSFTAIGLFDLIASKGRHIGWPLLLATGIFILVAFYVR